LTDLYVLALAINSSSGHIFAGTFSGGVFRSEESTTAVEEIFAPIPISFWLEQNYPNPFNPETTIRYQINQPGPVHLEIYNLLGQKIRTLVNEVQSAGAHSVNWDGLDDAGRSVSSGVYVYRLRADKSVASRKLVLLR
jgi:hypothetical protein